MTEQKIYPALAAVAKALPAIGKSAEAPQAMGGYRYRTIESIIAAARPLFIQQGLIGPVPEVIQHRMVSEVDKYGKPRTHVFLDIRFTVYAADGSSVSGIASGEAVDTGDKATPKAHTAALKVFLTQLLFIEADQQDTEAEIAEPAQPLPPPVALPDAFLQQLGKCKTKADVEALMKNADTVKYLTTFNCVEAARAKAGEIYNALLA